MRHIPTVSKRNFATLVLFGPTLIGVGLIGLFDGHPAVIALLVIPTVALFFLGVWTALVRPPTWLAPRPLDQRDETPRGRQR